jgi:hypothetical protein
MRPIQAEFALQPPPRTYGHTRRSLIAMSGRSNERGLAHPGTTNAQASGLGVHVDLGWS